MNIDWDRDRKEPPRPGQDYQEANRQISTEHAHMINERTSEKKIETTINSCGRKGAKLKIVMRENVLPFISISDNFLAGWVSPGRVRSHTVEAYLLIFNIHFPEQSKGNDKKC
ncbi:unnamed protein product [Callosobruchus maculatus]|uniref:Uncharacterized protein n=1 Tax=Callosobruchus maculatus TaxID=64391 RepID=A0A653DHD1_CALMS|nr:unnamed protein product [Callosobruchus maculatus]